MADQSQAYYERYWSEEAGFRPTGRLTGPILSLLTQHVPTKASCLDVGCGDGRTSGVWLQQHARRYVGVDIAENAVRQARKLGLDAQTIDDATSLPFGDETFDAVVCLEVLEHLFAPQEAVREMRRVLRVGGTLLATVPNAAYWRRRADLFFLGRLNPLGDDRSTNEPWRDPHIRFFNPWSLRRMLLGAGFAEVDVGGHGGTVTGDVPVLRRFFRARGWPHPTWQANPIYAALEQRAPGLLAYRLHGVARRR